MLSPHIVAAAIAAQRHPDDDGPDTVLDRVAHGLAEQLPRTQRRQFLVASGTELARPC